MKINKYVVELWHEPGMSPLSNPASRRMSNRTHEVLPGLMEKSEMKMIGAYHLDPEHRSILISEAQSVEDVRDVPYEIRIRALVRRPKSFRLRRCLRCTSGR